MSSVQRASNFSRNGLIIQWPAVGRKPILTTNVRLLDAPGNVLLPAKATGLPKDSVANVSQVITVDRDFLLGLAGRVHGQLFRDVEHGLRWVLGLQLHGRPRG
jgi:mRNA interferase MazF